MKKFYVLLILISFSCNHGKKYDNKKGYFEIKRDNGIPHYIKFYDNNKKLEGQSISFNSSGKIHSYTYMLKDQQVGSSMIYYENGTLNVLDTYLNGKKEGVSVHYNPEGILTRKTYYRNDLLDGEQYYFDYESGDTLRIEYYKKGQLIQIDSIPPARPSMSRHR